MINECVSMHTLFLSCPIEFYKKEFYLLFIIFSTQQLEYSLCYSKTPQIPVEPASEQKTQYCYYKQSYLCLNK